MNNGDDYVAMLEDEGTTGSGLTLAGWGLTTIAACVLGFASWQYAPPRSAPTEIAHADSALPDPSEVTGSITLNDRGQIQTGPSRVVGAAKVAPMPLASNETVATSRDIEQLRTEIKELQRRITQMGMSGDGVTRRIDRLEEKLVGDQAAARERLAAVIPPPAAEPATPPRIVEPVRTVEAEPVRPTDRIPLPAPRPAIDLPVVTGSIAPRTPEAPSDAATGPAAAKGARAAVAPAAAVTPPEPPKPAAESAKAETPAPAEAPAAPVAVASAAPATPTPAADAAALDLGGYRSLASLRRSWSDMTARYSEFGAKMEPLARLRETDNGMEARLLAGPYPNQAEAAKSCMRLKALGVNCAVTSYSGQPLAGVK